MDPPASKRRSGDLYIGRVLRVPVYLGPSWWFVAVLLTMVYAPTVRRAVPDLGPGAYLVSLAFALLLYASVLAHELGHCLVARAFGMPVRRIILHAFVGLSEIDEEARTPTREALIAAAGPGLSVVVTVVAVLVGRRLDPGTVPHVLAWELAISNGAIAVLNLLPGLPLDGGRVVRAVVWGASHNRVTGTIAAAWAGRVIAVVVGVGGVYLAWASGDSFALYNVVVSAMIGAFIWSGASAALQAARVSAALPGLRVATLLRRAMPVLADVPLAEALRRLGDDRARVLLVVDNAGEPVAIVNTVAAAAVPEGRRPWVSVGSLARTLQPGSTLAAELVGEDLLDAIRNAPAEDYLVRAADGTVVGVLATSDVAAAMTAGRAR